MARLEQEMPKGLLVVATPIGNLEDITMRALKALKFADTIAAEDTRQTLRLLNHFEIKKPLISCHDVNEKERSQQLIDRMRNGETIALVSDAGTPGISDPGEILIRSCIREGIPVTMMPGCSAVIMAVVLSGLPTDKFCFEGFLPQAGKERRQILTQWVEEERTIVFYESPHRIKEMLQDVKKVLGEREIAIGREMTKLHEEFIRGNVDTLINHFENTEPRGEFVVVLSGAARGTKEAAERKQWTEMSIADHVALHEKAGMSRMDAMKQAAKERGIGKREVYANLQTEQEN